LAGAEVITTADALHLLTGAISVGPGPDVDTVRISGTRRSGEHATLEASFMVVLRVVRVQPEKEGGAK
jgi:hypothetical protein